MGRGCNFVTDGFGNKTVFFLWFVFDLKSFSGVFYFVTGGLVLCSEFLSGFCTEYCFCGNRGNKFCDLFEYIGIFDFDDFYWYFLLPAYRLQVVESSAERVQSRVTNRSSTKIIGNIP